MTTKTIDQDTEEGLVSGIFTGGEDVFRLDVQPVYFGILKLGWIWESGRTLIGRGIRPDLTTMCDALEKRGELSEIGGEEYLNHLIQIGADYRDLREYARIVKEKYIEREGMAGLSDAAKSLGAGKYAEFIDRLERLEELAHNGNGHKPAKYSSWADLERMKAGIVFDWPDWLVVALLTELVGPQESGKSALALRIAKTYICGADWPDGTRFTGKPGYVVWAECEAFQAGHLERMIAWEIPRDKVLSPFADPTTDFQIDDPNHQAALLSVASRDDARLVIVDSLGGSTRRDMNSSDMMRPAKFLAELARDKNLPVILLHHLRKRGMLDGDEITLDRVLGSGTITQPARIVWAIETPDLAHKERRKLSVLKSNLGRKPAPIGFEFTDSGLVFGNAPQTPKNETQTDKAIDLLLALLAKGPMDSKTLEEEAKGAGLSWDTMKRAKDDLHIVARRDGKRGRWYWALPTLMQETLP